ncbi:DEAD/DEAH box helicase [Neorhizobium sp. BT27B]|uniref:DEAD/DEAH box helicase n=1 Tax=Neorhizobium sp. BT27B TaxID=3142625 RepID=UPI003D27E678
MGIDVKAKPLKPYENAEGTDLPAGFVASRLAAKLQKTNKPLCYVALSERRLDELAGAMVALFPDIELVILPPWDCLPYDRVPPSAHCMGRRMDALRLWCTIQNSAKLLLTSVEVTLQRIPPSSVIAKSQLELVVGTQFDQDAFFAFIRQTGYLEESVADDPGEVAVREGVIDIYPAGAPGPMRIVISEEGLVEELRGFDRVSQRTESYLERVIFGPASEAVSPQTATENTAPGADTMERLLQRLYQDMPTVFDFIGDTALHLAAGAQERVTRYLEIVDDARQFRHGYSGTNPMPARSLHLSHEEWQQYIGKRSADAIDLQGSRHLPAEMAQVHRQEALVNFIHNELQQGQTVVISGNGKGPEALTRRVVKRSGITPLLIERWEAGKEAAPGSLLRLHCELEESFIDDAAKVALIAVSDRTEISSEPITLLAEPELRIGDVVVHENYGVGVLKNLETIVVDGIPNDAARLEYRDESSVLVPMEEFDKLWRYGSEPEAVTLDRLHTDAWQKKREQIASDIHSTARHLLKIARQRQSSQAEKFVPPRAKFSAFVRRFPYAETADQSEAIVSVLADLASGKVMNRLICGDVGFGKTEIALRAAAAVSLSGGQVAVVAPTTVLARQHFATFERRFAGTGIKVAILSRLLKPSETKRVKATLAEGDIDIIIATQAILSNDVRFSRLSLLVVDEEHRFGLKEKRAMASLAPSLHTLAMSATPIPRTLQSAMVGIQEVSLLTTPPLKRRPVRTSLSTVDRASMRTGLMREYRRGGQSFVVVPRIEDIEGIEAMLRSIVPELSIKVAHGKMQAAAIDETIVDFAEGHGDILLATNIIETGIDVPRANSIFILHAERFGLAQLHQLRGRVGRAVAQGMAYLLMDETKEQAEDTQRRLATLVDNDRLGAGFAISLRDFDLRGGGDLTGDDQAGHMRVIGTGLYQTMLAGAVAKLRKQSHKAFHRPVFHLGIAGVIPADYVADPSVRLNLYARLLRASTLQEINDLEEEFEDRFGNPPHDATRLLRRQRLQLTAGRLGITKVEAGPKAVAVTVTSATPARVTATLLKSGGGVRRDDRIIFEVAPGSADEQLSFFERIFASFNQKPKRR